ncbi:rhodanese-like domain-containing protein [Streptomyces sp. NPDC058755]|uniref:rhodanese-like domain-containing protein n=1 Tax=Streptomyces sp. NPDC058755 TaxID=3346624 RepID=UPI0036805A14
MVDVREADGYAVGHVPGARLMPLRTVPTRCGALPAGRPVYVICAGGNRSRTAAGWVHSRHIDAHSMAGGTGARARGGRHRVAGSHEHAA